jgi:3-methyladenine DNA glycosylase/8-oxoguanine DNA glycosylase
MKIMATQIFYLDAPPFYNLNTTCSTHGWQNLAPFFYSDKKELSFAVSIDNNSMDVSIIQDDDTKVKATITHFGKLRSSSKVDLIKHIERVLDLKTDLTGLSNQAKKAGKIYFKLIQMGAGRLLRSPTIWEDAAKTLFTTNCSWNLTRKMCEFLCSSKFSSPTPNGKYPFPHFHKIRNYSEDEIKSLVPVGYRAKYFLSLAERFTAEDDLKNIDKRNLSHNQAFKMAKSLYGFGNYASAHLLIMSGYYNFIPVDTVVTSFVMRNYRTKNCSDFIKRHYDLWGDYKWWGIKFDKMLLRQNWIGD